MDSFIELLMPKHSEVEFLVTEPTESEIHVSRDNPDRIYVLCLVFCKCRIVAVVQSGTCLILACRCFNWYFLLCVGVERGQHSVFKAFH